LANSGATDAVQHPSQKVVRLATAATGATATLATQQQHGSNINSSAQSQ